MGAARPKTRTRINGPVERGEIVQPRKLDSRFDLRWQLKSKSFVDDKQRDDRKIGQTRQTSACVASISPQTPANNALLEEADNAQSHNDSREQTDMGAAFSSASGGGAEKDSTSPRGPMLSLSCRRESPEKPVDKPPHQLLDFLVEFIQEQGGRIAVADVSEFYKTYPELAAEQVIAQMGGLRSFCGRNKHLVAYRAGYISLRESASHAGHSSRPSSTELQSLADHIPEQRITDARDNGWQGQNHHQENRHLHQHLQARLLVEQENEAAACVAAASLLKLSRATQSPALTPTALSPREPSMFVRVCVVYVYEHSRVARGMGGVKEIDMREKTKFAMHSSRQHTNHCSSLRFAHSMTFRLLR